MYVHARKMMGFQLKKLVICFSISTAEPCSTGELLTEKAEENQCHWTAVRVGIEVGWRTKKANSCAVVDI